jgi:hypothetical protein
MREKLKKTKKLVGKERNLLQITPRIDTLFAEQYPFDDIVVAYTLL